MKDKIARIKAAANKYRYELTFGLGVGVGVGAVLMSIKPVVHEDIFLGADSADLQKLIDDPQGGLRWVAEKSHDVILCNNLNSYWVD